MTMTMVKMLAPSGHYAVYCGSERYAEWKWYDFYPGVPFDGVVITCEQVY